MNRQSLLCGESRVIRTITTVIIDGIGYTTTTSRTQKAGIRSLPTMDGVQDRTSDAPVDCLGTTYSVCKGPYTIELLTRDSRVTATGSRVTVNTDATDSLDDSGRLEILYILKGTRTVTTAAKDGFPASERIDECDLYQRAGVQIGQQRRSGMTEVVALHAPSAAWLGDTTTTTWTCTQAIIDEGVQCDLNAVVSTTRANEFPTPSGCVVIVTVAKNGRGHGSTACLPQAQAQSHGTMIGLNINDLPTCPKSTNTEVMNGIDPTPSTEDGEEEPRKRCVARN